MMNKMMKKVAIVLAAVTMATTCATPALANDGMHVVFQINSESGTKTVTASEANVRKEPSTDVDVMYTLNCGDTVSISGSTDNGWYLLSDGGYIRKDMVGDSSERHDSDHHGNVVEGNEYTVHVNNGYLALRFDRNYDENNEIGPLWNGSTVKVLDNMGDGYVRVEVTHTASGEYGENLDGRVGYVNASYLQ